MMRKVLVTTIATLATAMLFTMTRANAAIYDFTFHSNDSELTAAGQFTVNAANEVTAISGAVSGLTNQAISGVTANPSFPGSSYSRDGSFIYDNLYSPPATPLITAGCCSPRRGIQADTGISGQPPPALTRSMSRPAATIIRSRRSGR
jgi:hypothetical protein